MNRKQLSAAVAAVLICGAVAAAAANNTFFTSIGDLVFPFSPPTASAPGTIDNMTIGATTPRPGSFTTLSASVGISSAAQYPAQGAPAAKTVSGTMTAADLASGIVTVLQGAAAASAQQLPLATAMDTGFPGVAVGFAFDFSVINISATAAEAASLTTNTGWTLVGDMDVLANSAATTKSAGRFRARKTATGAWTLYRLS